MDRMEEELEDLVREVGKYERDLLEKFDVDMKGKWGEEWDQSNPKDNVPHAALPAT